MHKCPFCNSEINTGRCEQGNHFYSNYIGRNGRILWEKIDLENHTLIYEYQNNQPKALLYNKDNKLQKSWNPGKNSFYPVSYEDLSNFLENLSLLE